MKNQDIRTKSKFQRPFDGDNGQFTSQEFRKVRITERIFQKGLENPFEL